MKQTLTFILVLNHNLFRRLKADQVRYLLPHIGKLFYSFVHSLSWWRDKFFPSVKHVFDWRWTVLCFEFRNILCFSCLLIMLTREKVMKLDFCFTCYVRIHLFIFIFWWSEMNIEIKWKLKHCRKPCISNHLATTCCALITSSNMWKICTYCGLDLHFKLKNMVRDECVLFLI